MPVVHILCGPSGCGKSTLADRLRLGYNTSVVCSADHFFIGPDGYQFDPRKLPQAHSSCMLKYIGALRDGADCIIVDNTNLQDWERVTHEEAGHLAAYEVLYHAWEVPIDMAPVLAARNRHGVPLEAIEAMIRRFEVPDGPTVFHDEILVPNGDNQ